MWVTLIWPEAYVIGAQESHMVRHHVYRHHLIFFRTSTGLWGRGCDSVLETFVDIRYVKSCRFVQQFDVIHTTGENSLNPQKCITQPPSWKVIHLECWITLWPSTFCMDPIQNSCLINIVDKQLKSMSQQFGTSWIQSIIRSFGRPYFLLSFSAQLYCLNRLKSIVLIYPTNKGLLYKD